MTCETVCELLLDYVEGELPTAQAEPIRAHLAECCECAAKYRETCALVGDLGAARSIQRQDAEPDRSQQLPLVSPVLEEHARIGDFEILAELGRGGMGVVYRARQISLNRIVALKLLSGQLVQSERSIRRFTREAQAAARLHHTNIVPIYAQGCEEKCFYYAMELIEGESLDKVLRRQHEHLAGAAAERRRGAARHATTRRLSSPLNLLRSAASSIGLSGVTRTGTPHQDYRRIVRWVGGVAEGLHHAHEQGVIHRDIKPQNLLLGPDDELHITDFGLARILDEPALTQSSELVGTPAYMAPEQITGGRAALDRRTDIYALGVTLYEMLTLQRPFCAETYDQTIHQILSREPPPPRRIDPHIPADLETICLRAMEKERQRRFATAAEMARDLRRWAEGFPINSRPLGPVGKAVRWVRRHPWRAAVIATTALLVILIPLAVSFFSAMASAEIDRALAVLLNDYREQDRALAELGWAGRIGGDRRRRDLVEAFASVRTDPRRSIEILEPAVAEHPDDPDLHYLLAWAYTRRIPTRGVEVWADAERQIALADALRREASAAGWFFRGQAVWGIDPEEAVRSLERAIKRADEEGFTFMQAMLHQGRAMNQIMYSWRALDPLRAISFYEKAVGRLEYAALGQQKRAYPRYLLALTHLLAAEIYRQGDEQGQQKAERLFDIALRTAQDAQRVEPSSPRGYAAEAQCYESRGKFAAETRSPQWRQDFDRAIGVWRQFDNSALDVHRATSDDSERFEYQMRLHFWLGQCAQAEQMRQSRYGPQTGYSRERCFDGDDSFLEALLAASDGEPSRAVQALAAGAQFAIQNPEYGLRLDAAYRLLGREPPPALLPREIPADCDLSPGWTPAWLATLIGYQRSELDWPAVEQAARAGTQHPDEARLRMAGAYFYRGIRELAAGRRPAALDAFKSSRDRYDNENYCFRAELLLVKLLTDPAWPSWLAADAPASP